MKLTHEQLSRVLSEHAAGSLDFAGSDWKDGCCVAEAALVTSVKEARLLPGNHKKHAFWRISDAASPFIQHPLNLYGAKTADALLRKLEQAGLASMVGEED